MNRFGCYRCKHEFDPPQELTNRGKPAQKEEWDAYWRKHQESLRTREYWSQIKCRLDRLKDHEYDRLLKFGDQLSRISPGFPSFSEAKKDLRRRGLGRNLAQLKRSYVLEHLVYRVDIREVLKHWEAVDSAKGLPQLTSDHAERLLGPVALFLCEDDDDKLEAVVKVRTALKASVVGPPTLQDLINDIIVFFHDTAPHGQKARATAEALDARGIPCHLEGNWRGALSCQTEKVRAFFTMRRRRAAKIQNKQN